MTDLTVPDEFDEWPFDAKRFVLAEANTAKELREEVDGLVGLDGDGWKKEKPKPNAFTKEQLAAIVMALGGPQ